MNEVDLWCNLSGLLMYANDRLFTNTFRRRAAVEDDGTNAQNRVANDSWRNKTHVGYIGDNLRTAANYENKKENV